MLTVFTEEGAHARRVAAALGSQEPAIWADCWEGLERSLPAATCAIVVLGWLRGEPPDQRLRGLRAKYPLRPIVLVTSKDADNARALRSAAVEEVVWLSEIEAGLWPAVRRAQASTFLQRAAAAMDQILLRYPLLRSAVGYACRSERPVRSVGQLAQALGCDRRTLWRHWHLAVASRVPLRLEDVLDWVLLLHAVGRKIPSRSWASIACELQVHPHTLGRLAIRLAERPLRALAAGDQIHLAIRFYGQLLGPLVGDCGREEWDARSVLEGGNTRGIGVA